MTETFDINRYRRGYSLGVGGVVVCNDKVLLVRSSYGHKQWTIPGGYVEAGETVDAAVKREIMEETGVQAELQGLIGARNRINPDDNSTYLMFLLSAADEVTTPDKFEVDEARYFTLEELRTLSEVTALSQMIAIRVLEQKASLLTLHPHPTIPASEYVMWL